MAMPVTGVLSLSRSSELAFLMYTQCVPSSEMLSVNLFLHQRGQEGGVTSLRLICQASLDRPLS